jgi:hypothetical protein
MPVASRKVLAGAREMVLMTLTGPKGHQRKYRVDLGMHSIQARTLIVVSSLLLGGCSVVGDTLWPSSGASNSNSGFRLEIPPSQAEKDAIAVLSPEPVLVGTGSVTPVAVTEGPATGSLVGQKIAGLRGELKLLSSKMQENDSRLQTVRGQTLAAAQTYHSIVANISARLQVGTTPGNPILSSQWNQAQVSLETLSGSLAQMNRLASDGAANSATAAFILDSSRAIRGLSGALDEDHRQLSILEDETNRTVVQVDRLLSEVTGDLQRQTAYLGTERAHLTTLNNAIKVGQLYGASLGTFALAGSALPAALAAAPASASSSAPANLNGKRPLVVIRFERDDVVYREQLYAALSQSLERKPEATFDVVSVAPASGSAAQLQLSQNKARQSAQNVVRSMADMGMPAGRIRLSSLTSDEVNANEVHVYVR